MSFIQTLLPRIQKDQVQEDLNISVREMETTVIPSYMHASDFFRTSKFTAEPNKELTTDFYRNFDLQGGSKQATLVSEVYKRLPFIKENIGYIQGLIEEVMERDIIAEGLTAKKATLLRAAEHLSFISRFSLDLLNLIYVNEAGSANADVLESMRLSPGATRHVEKNIVVYARLVSDYGIPLKDFQKIYLRIPEVVLSQKTSQAISGLYREGDLDPFASAHVSGFTGSPIYHIRLMVAEWQSNRYKSNKETAQMLQLRLLHLKLLHEKKNDPKLEKEIEYVQGRVDKIQRYLREVEESLEQND